MNSNYYYVAGIGVVLYLVITILFGYTKDFKTNKKEFLKTIAVVGTGMVAVVMFMKYFILK